MPFGPTDRWAERHIPAGGGTHRMQIETERLILREFVSDDWLVMARYWRDPRYQHFYPENDDPAPIVRELVERFVAAQATSPRLKRQLVIVERASDAMIGNCGIRINDPEIGEANIGYELDPDFWGHGYATEAARAIVRFGFEDLALHRIWAECIADNRGSWRVMERLGMRREAHVREHQHFRDRWWDTFTYAILDHEWQARGGSN